MVRTHQQTSRVHLQTILAILLSHWTSLEAKLACRTDEGEQMLILLGDPQLEEALQEVQHKQASGLGGQPPENVSTGGDGHAYAGGSLVHMPQVHDHANAPSCLVHKEGMGAPLAR